MADVEVTIDLDGVLRPVPREKPALSGSLRSGIVSNADLHRYGAKIAPKKT
jgi:hypothetical protein